MNPVSTETLIDQLNWRYATKKFDATKKIPADQWAALEEATVLSPSSFGLQPWKFIVVTDPALRATLKVKSWNQPQVTDASHLMVFARRASMSRVEIDAYIDRIVEVRKVPRETLNGYRDMMAAFIEKPAPAFDVKVWTSCQVYIALGVFLSAAAMLGIDACPMEGIDPAAYDEVLGLKAKGFATTVVAAAGYRASDDPIAAMAKVRMNMEDAIERR